MPNPAVTPVEVFTISASPSSCSAVVQLKLPKYKLIASCVGGPDGPVIDMLIAHGLRGQRTRLAFGVKTNIHPGERSYFRFDDAGDGYLEHVEVGGGGEGGFELYRPDGIETCEFVVRLETCVDLPGQPYAFKDCVDATLIQALGRAFGWVWGVETSQRARLLVGDPNSPKALAPAAHAVLDAIETAVDARGRRARPVVTPIKLRVEIELPAVPTELAALFIADPGWRWVPAMRYRGIDWDPGLGWVRVRDDAEHVAVLNRCRDLPGEKAILPDTEDPATLGCIEHVLVPEALGDPHAYLGTRRETWISPAASSPLELRNMWYVCSPKRDECAPSRPTKAAALLEGLRLAARK